MILVLIIECQYAYNCTRHFCHAGSIRSVDHGVTYMCRITSHNGTLLRIESKINHREDLPLSRPANPKKRGGG